MWTSPEKYILTNNGEVKVAGPGVSGSLIVAKGSQISEQKASQYGLLPGQKLATNLNVNEPTSTAGVSSISQRTQFRPKGDKEPPRNEQGLRTDGPTIEEWTKAGYPAASYPPDDYVGIPSEGWQPPKEESVVNKPWSANPATETSTGSGLSLGGTPSPEQVNQMFPPIGSAGEPEK